MKNKFLFIIFTLLNFSLYSAGSFLPKIIDYGKYLTIDQPLPKKQTKVQRAILDDEEWFFGNKAFNYAPEITPVFAFLKQKYQIGTAIETGTALGSTTVVLSYLFDSVQTIEINEAFYLIVRKKLESFSNVQCHFGSSEKVLAELLPSLKHQTVLFYLDAHWDEYWPLLDELVVISKTHKDNCIIVIDDFKVPQRKDIAYDEYGTQECSYEYIKKHLEDVFSSYSIHYLIPRSTSSRAKCIIIPNEFKRINKRH